MEIKKRETFDELFLYDIDKDRWLDPVLHRNDETISSYALKHTPSSQHDDNSLVPFSLQAPWRRYAHAAAMIGSQLVIHGGIDGDENILILEGNKSMIAAEFALFDFQARYWMKIKQD